METAGQTTIKNLIIDCNYCVVGCPYAQGCRGHLSPLQLWTSTYMEIDERLKIKNYALLAFLVLLCDLSFDHSKICSLFDEKRF